MNNWDLLIMWPVILAVCLVAYFIVVRVLKVTKPSQWFYILQHGFFWFSFSMVLNLNYNFDANNLHWISNNWGILIAVASAFYAAIFFIPGSWISGKYRSRKLYYWASYGFGIIGLILALVIQSPWALAVGCCFIGVGLASNSLWYLCFNEVFFHSTRPFSSLVVLLPNMLLATGGGWIVNNFTKQFITNLHTENYTLLGLTLAFLIISAILNLFLKERKILIGAFEAEFLRTIAPFRWRKIILILGLLFFVGAMREIGNGDLESMVLAQDAWNWYHQATIVSHILHANQPVWWIAQALGTALVGLLFWKHVRLQYIFGLAGLLWIFYFVFLGFVHVPVFILVMQIINGLALGMMFTILFGLTIMWNYRVAQRPVTGCFSALNAFVTFLFQWIQRAIYNNHVGIFNGININSWATPYVKDSTLYTNHLHDVIAIIAICAILVSLIVTLVFIWKARWISGEYWMFNERVVNIIEKRVSRLYDFHLINSQTALDYYLRKTEQAVKPKTCK